MKAVIQRVSKASVTVDNKVVSKIGTGLLILLGIENEDSLEDVQWLSRKISNLRIFNDEEGVMNKSLLNIDGEIVCFSFRRDCDSSRSLWLALLVLCGVAHPVGERRAQSRRIHGIHSVVLH